MVGVNKQKVYVGLVSHDFPLSIRKGWLDTDIKAVECRTRFFGDRIMCLVPDGVVPFKYKKRYLFFADPAKKVCVPLGAVIINLGADFEAKIDLYMRNKFWKFLSTRGFDLVETLIMFGAGYGFLRLVEVFITQAFGK